MTRESVADRPDGRPAIYDPKRIEEKWQKRWAERGTNTWTDAALRGASRPFFNLMMFPYPSAEGLHVGNMYAFTGADVYGRWRKLSGDDVFEPIGFDAFGIHSENFALKMGVNPMDLIPRNIRNFTRQLRRIGAMYDWNHTIDSTDPDYYRWTQWLFLQLYRAGLAEKEVAPVNWCPSCHTVLANEQVIAGACERCGTTVAQRLLSQWFFRITRYAERLLANLSWIDWSESTKKAQANWIGRSEGAEIRFSVMTAGGGAPPAADLVIPVFTTRPETVFGATFIVLAPEHPLVEWITPTGYRESVDQYRSRVAAIDLVTRRKTEQEKTGVPTGAHVRNPATGRDISVWIADYVRMEYGTGAIMGVPGHDERDFEFATRHDLPIRRVIAGAGEDADTPLEGAYLGPGVMVNSDAFDGTDGQEGKGSVTRWLAERGAAEPRVNYRLHDWCISRQRYWGPPIPIVYCEACGTVPVPEADLPVELPRLDDYTPDESGVSPLARVEAWYRVPCPRCGGLARRETDVSDTFLDSAWYFLRYPSTGRHDVPFERELTERWLPVAMYIGGEEHAVLHLLYSRFVTMALKDLGHIDFEEPYQRFRKHGLVIKDGAKMSKSRGNVVVPDHYIERWGADAFRLYLMFLGPYQEGGDFRDEGLSGPYGFLHRLWETIVPGEALGEGALTGLIERKLHATIGKVTEDIAALRYNTAIAAIMEYLNVVREGGRCANRAEVEPLVPLVAPFAPHLAEELWERLGHADGLFEGKHWPAHDAARATADAVELVVQVNGKVRTRLVLPRGFTEDQARALALADDNVRRHLDGHPVRRVVFVPDRLINLVVGS